MSVIALLFQAAQNGADAGLLEIPLLGNHFVDRFHRARSGIPDHLHDLAFEFGKGSARERRTLQPLSWYRLYHQRKIVGQAISIFNRRLARK